MAAQATILAMSSEYGGTDMPQCTDMVVIRFSDRTDVVVHGQVSVKCNTNKF